MDFIVGDSVILGVCVSLSESGLRGTFSNPVPSGTNGLLTVYHRDHSVQVHAQVQSMKADEARVGFHFNSDQEREDIQNFLKRLAPVPASRRQPKP